MKTLLSFRNTLKKGISLLIEKYGFENDNENCLKFSSQLKTDETNKQVLSVTDDNIMAAVRWAMKQP